MLLHKLQPAEKHYVWLAEAACVQEGPQAEIKPAAKYVAALVHLPPEFSCFSHLRCVSVAVLHIFTLNPRWVLHILPQILYLFALEARQACPEKHWVTKLMDPLCTAQNGYRPRSDQVSTNSAVLGATFVTMKKDLHSQKLERTPPWGNTSVSYPLDSTTFKQKVLPALLQKWPKNAVLSGTLPTTTPWTKN